MKPSSVGAVASGCLAKEKKIAARFASDRDCGHWAKIERSRKESQIPRMPELVRAGLEDDAGMRGLRDAGPFSPATEPLPHRFAKRGELLRAKCVRQNAKTGHSNSDRQKQNDGTMPERPGTRPVAET